MRFLAPIIVLAALPFIALAQEQNVPPAQDKPYANEPDPEPAGDRLRIDIDYLYWFLERMRVPALLTSGSPGTEIGALGPDTLYGDDRLDSRHGRYVGVRFDIDYWLDDDRTFGFDVSAFFLERDSSNFTVPWGTIPLLARPYVNAADGSPGSFVIAGPSPVGNLTGGFNAYSRIEFFGEEANALCNLARGSCWSLDALGGLRFLQMRERLDLTGVSKILPDETTLLSQTDHFDTFNKFYGLQAGLLGEMRYGRRFAEGRLALALGGDDQEIRTYGNRLFQTPQERITNDYGVYVLPSNRGTFERGAVDFVTEIRLNVGYEFTKHIRARVGYTFLSWLNPVRPGDQIAPIDLAQVAPGAPPFTGKPSVPFREDFFWAQGVNVGLEFRW